MMYEMVSDSGILVSAELTERSPCIQLHEGRADRSEKKPLDLAIGEMARVSYPLLDRAERYVCHVKRIE